MVAFARGNEPGNLPRWALAEFRKTAPGISASRDAPVAPPTVTRSSSYWECTDGETILTVDLRGNASYRRIPGWVPDPPADGGAPGALWAATLTQLGSFSGPGGWRRRGFPPSGLTFSSAAVKRETLLLAKVPAGAIHEMRGRTIVRLFGMDESVPGSFRPSSTPTAPCSASISPWRMLPPRTSATSRSWPAPRPRGGRRTRSP